MKVRVDKGCLYVVSAWVGIALIIVSICAFCQEEYFTIGTAIGLLIFGLLCLIPPIIKLVKFNIEFSSSRNSTTRDINEFRSDTSPKILLNVDSDDDNNMCEEMENIISDIKEEGGTRFVKTAFDDDQAAKFLLTVCEQTPNTPPLINFAGLYLITEDKLIGMPALTYYFRTHKGVVGMLLRVYLVRCGKHKIRFFTVETSFPFALCEYKDGIHLNYGQVDLQSVPLKIRSIISPDIPKACIKPQSNEQREWLTAAEFCKRYKR